MGNQILREKKVKGEKYNATNKNILRIKMREIFGLSERPQNEHWPRVSLW